MRKPSRPQLLAGLIFILVLASLAVGLAAGFPSPGGGDEEFAVESDEPTPSGTTSGALKGAGADSPLPPASSPRRSGGRDGAEQSGSANPKRVPPAAGDSPVSSGDGPRPQPTTVSDPPAAFNGIRTFEDCAAAGYPIAESYPEQCRTPDGRLFVRTVD